MFDPSGNAIPVLVPHLHREHGRLVSQLRGQPSIELEASDDELLSAIARGDRYETIATAMPGHIARLQRWAADGVIVLVEPTEALPDQAAVVCVEPHFDDAVLSAGGSLYRRRGKIAVRTITIFDTSNYTSDWEIGQAWFDVSEISALRRAENALAMRCLGATWTTLGCLDYPLRVRDASHWNTTTFEADKRELGKNLLQPPSPDAVARLTVRLRDCLSGVAISELWFPLGVGNHPDHVLAREACLSLLATGTPQGATFMLYVDVPYCVWDPTALDQQLAALAERGFELLARHEPIANEIEAKISLARIYGSQYRIATPQLVRDAAALLEPGQFVETRYELVRSP